MLEGKDGYDCFKGKEFIVDRDNGQLLSLMLRYVDLFVMVAY